MAKILDMPKLSPTMEEGELSAWHKAEGDAIDIDDLLAEVETDKATMEFRSFDKGVLLKILVPAGSTVLLGQAVGIIGKAGEDISGLLAEIESGGGKPAPAAAAAPAAEAPAAQPSAQAAAPTAEPEPQSAFGARLRTSPYVRKLARERGIDLAQVKGSGPRGRIVARDLEGVSAAPREAALPTPAAMAAPGLAAPEVRPLSRMRKTIAKRLTQSKQEVPHFYLTIDVNAGALMALRKDINRDLAQTDAEKPLKISVNDMLIKACALALKAVPECNAQYTPDALLFHQRVDISVAVAIDDGLVTPVVRDADQKSLGEIQRSVRDLAARARKKKLSPEEMSNGTFSISNLGMFGIDSFSAVINPPEGAILAVSRVRPEPVVVDGEVVAGQKMSMTLSCDHRVIDGAVGARFLAELRRLLENPMQILVR